MTLCTDIVVFISKFLDPYAIYTFRQVSTFVRDNVKQTMHADMTFDSRDRSTLFSESLTIDWDSVNVMYLMLPRLPIRRLFVISTIHAPRVYIPVENSIEALFIHVDQLIESPTGAIAHYGNLVHTDTVNFALLPQLKYFYTQALRVNCPIRLDNLIELEFNQINVVSVDNNLWSMIERYYNQIIIYDIVTWDALLRDMIYYPYCERFRVIMLLRSNVQADLVHNFLASSEGIARIESACIFVDGEFAFPGGNTPDNVEIVRLQAGAPRHMYEYAVFKKLSEL